MAKNKTSQVDMRKEDYATNKVLVVFSTCLLGVLVLMALQRFLNYGDTFLMGLFLCKILIVIAAGIVIWGAVLFWMERFRGRSAQYRVMCGKNVLLVGVLSVLMLTAVNYFGAIVMKPFYVLLPALAIYYLVFHSYVREFFWLAVDAGTAIFASWFMHRSLNNGHGMLRVYVILGVGLICVAIQIALVVKHQTRHSKGKLKETALSKNAYLMLKISPVVFLAISAVSAFVMGGIYIACLAIIGAYLFAATVYYTVKMM